MERRINPKTTLIPKSIQALDTTVYSKDMYIVVDEKQPDGTYKTKKMLLDTILNPITPPTLDIFPDPYTKGERTTKSFRLENGMHEGKWVNSVEYPSGTKNSTANIGYNNLGFQTCDELIFSDSLPTLYGDGLNHDPVYLKWLGYSTNLIKEITGSESVTELELVNKIGGLFFQSEGVRFWNDINVKIGDYDYTLPTKQHWLQLLGQMPIVTNDMLKNAVDFFGYKDGSSPYVRNVLQGLGTSGLDIFPTGSRGGGQSDGHYGIGYSALLACKNSDRFNIINGDIGGVKGIAFNKSSHGLQVRIARHKTPQELGYKIIDTGSEFACVPLENSASAELPVGLLRGLVLRYLNREHKKVCATYNQINTEALELLTQIKNL